MTQTPPETASAVVFAYHDIGVRCLAALLELGIDIKLVVTHTDNPSELIWFDSVEDLAMRNGIEVITPENPNSNELIERVAACRPDFIFSFYFREMLGQTLLDIPARGAFNLHGSLLPKYRGRVPVNWAIIHGEKETGNTMMFLDAGVDTGDIIAQRRFPIEDDDTCATIYDKVARSEDDMLREIMPLIHQGRMPRSPQDHTRATVMPRRRPKDGAIDWRRTSRELHDWVRALTHPYPGAFTRVTGRLLRVWQVSPWPGQSSGHGLSGVPGWWQLAGDPPALLAATADGYLRIERVQVEGDEEVDGLAFASRWLPDGGSQAELEAS